MASRSNVFLPPIEATPEKITQSLFHPSVNFSDAMEYRNSLWRGHPLIPSWVELESVNLDQFYTHPIVAHECWTSLLSAMHEDHAKTDDYVFVDPGAGLGVFYDILPSTRRIGIDLVPSRREFIREDYLSWHPPKKTKYVVVGNPPFGYRAWLALSFVNWSATFADYIGFILPMAFQSDGKGSPKNRVQGAELIQSKSLPHDAFTNAKGQSAKINALWQVWKRGVNNPAPVETCNEWIDLFTVDMRKERLCGQERMNEADWFLQRTFYNNPPSLVRQFSDVRYVCGYGIVFKKHPDKLVKCLKGIDWRKYSNLAAHNCRHISMYHIRQAVIDGGFVDE